MALGIKPQHMSAMRYLTREASAIHQSASRAACSKHGGLVVQRGVGSSSNGTASTLSVSSSHRCIEFARSVSPRCASRCLVLRRTFSGFFSVVATSRDAVASVSSTHNQEHRLLSPSSPNKSFVPTEFKLGAIHQGWWLAAQFKRYA
jgi:hypothetical protein